MPDIAVLWCHSLRAHYICIVAVWPATAAKSIADFIKLVAVEKQFLQAPMYFCIQFINLLESNEEVPQRASRKTFEF